VRRVRAAAGVGALGSLVALPVQAALGTGRGPGSLFDHGVLGRVLTDGVGPALGLGLIGLGLLAAALGRSRALTAAGAVVAATSFAATGHDRVGDLAALATVADVVHLLVVAVWGGGLVLLFWTLRARRRAPDAAGPGADGTGATPALVLRFSSLATVAVLAAGATGATLAWREVRTLHALTSTGYGRVLLAKVAVVAVIGALGAYNHFRLMPALRGGKTKAGLRRLRHTVRIEAVALVAVIGLTAVVVAMTPGRTLAQGGPVEKIIQLDKVGSVQVVVAPARAGFNQMHLYTFDPDHRPAQLAESVQIQLTLPAAQLGPIDRTAARAGPAHYQLNGRDLSIAGTWTITVQLKIDRFTQVSGTTDVKVAG
jgi:copper transport protein